MAFRHYIVLILVFLFGLFGIMYEYTDRIEPPFNEHRIANQKQLRAPNNSDVNRSVDSMAKKPEMWRITQYNYNHQEIASYLVYVGYFKIDDRNNLTIDAPDLKLNIASGDYVAKRVQ